MNCNVKISVYAVFDHTGISVCFGATASSCMHHTTRLVPFQDIFACYAQVQHHTYRESSSTRHIEIVDLDHGWRAKTGADILDSRISQLTLKKPGANLLHIDKKTPRIVSTGHQGSIYLLPSRPYFARTHMHVYL